MIVKSMVKKLLQFSKVRNQQTVTYLTIRQTTHFLRRFRLRFRLNVHINQTYLIEKFTTYPKILELKSNVNLIGRKPAGFHR